MIDLSTVTPQLQATHWGWTIALFLWLIGLSGMGFFINYWTRQKNYVYVLTICGIAGLALVTSHLGRLTNLPIVIFYALKDFSFNFQSWMMIGIVLLSLLSIGSLFYSMICSGVVFKGDKWQRLVQSNLFNGVFAVLGVCSTIYSGFLLTQAVGVTLWNSSLIPVLWIMSGLTSSIALLELMSAFGWVDHKSVGWCSRTSVWVDTAKLFAIFSFIYVALGSASIGTRVGAEALISGNQALMFWIGGITFGTALPLLINLTTRSHKAIAGGAIFAVFGALFLRASILFSGYYDALSF